MKSQLALLLACVLLVTATRADDYQMGRKLETSLWERKTLGDSAASCYNTKYYYYTSWKATSDQAAYDNPDHCKTLTDPNDTTEQDAKDRRNYLLMVTLIPIFGGLCLFGTICTACVIYFGGTKGWQMYQEQKFKSGSKRKRASTI